MGGGKLKYSSKSNNNRCQYSSNDYSSFDSKESRLEMVREVLMLLKHASELKREAQGKMALSHTTDDCNLNHSFKTVERALCDLALRLDCNTYHPSDDDDDDDSSDDTISSSSSLSSDTDKKEVNNTKKVSSDSSTSPSDDDDDDDDDDSSSCFSLSSDEKEVNYSKRFLSDSSTSPDDYDDDDDEDDEDSWDTCSVSSPPSSPHLHKDKQD